MDVVYRTARVGLRVTHGQARRCFGLLVAAGDVRAALIAVNETRFRRGARPIGDYQEWCREIAGVRVGELSVAAMRSVVRRYSDAFFATAARKRAAESARHPRRRRRLVPVRWHHDTFCLKGRRLRLSTARGTPELWVRLAREVPYPVEHIRSVGDPQGITHARSGKKQNWRLHAWRRTHLTNALIDKAARVGIRVVRVDERATSSTCPACQRRVPKPTGRKFSCPHCG